jgi:hypothetical protein
MLALALAAATGWQAVSLAQPTGSAAASKPTCECCAGDPATCSTPSCCAGPADGRAPAAPTVPRCAPGNAWQAIATAPLALSTLPRSTLYDLPLRSPPFEAEAVPIFQRYCSFLI